MSFGESPRAIRSGIGGARVSGATLPNDAVTYTPRITGTGCWPESRCAKGVIRMGDASSECPRTEKVSAS